MENKVWCSSQFLQISSEVAAFSNDDAVQGILQLYSDVVAVNSCSTVVLLNLPNALCGSVLST